MLIIQTYPGGVRCQREWHPFGARRVHDVNITESPSPDDVASPRSLGRWRESCPERSGAEVNTRMDPIGVANGGPRSEGGPVRVVVYFDVRPGREADFLRRCAAPPVLGELERQPG